jgi:hypothetical protein
VIYLNTNSLSSLFFTLVLQYPLNNNNVTIIIIIVTTTTTPNITVKYF